MLAGRDRTGLAEVLGLELRNVVANYPFERSRGFSGSEPNSGHLHRPSRRLSSASANMEYRRPERVANGNDFNTH